ncbi:MAG: hypothetical protein RRY22_04365 [Bacilli bacterium]
MEAIKELEQVIENGELISKDYMVSFVKEYLKDENIINTPIFGNVGMNNAIYTPAKKEIVINYEKLIKDQEILQNICGKTTDTLKLLKANFLILSTLTHELTHVEQIQIMEGNKEANPLIKQLLVDVREFVIKQKGIIGTQFYTSCPLEYNANFNSYTNIISLMNEFKTMYPQYNELFDEIYNNSPRNIYINNPNYIRLLQELYFKNYSTDEGSYIKNSPVSTFYEKTAKTKETFDIITDSNYEDLNGYEILSYGFPVGYTEEQKIYRLSNAQSDVKSYLN